MKYSEMRPGFYVVRTRELSWARALSGAICHIASASPEQVILQLTEDCVPKGKKLSFGADANDGCWRNVTDLVLDANSVILPPDNMCSFNSPVSANYRNFLGLNRMQPLDGDNAVGEICLLGEQSSNGLVFGKSGYFVAAHSDGWYIAYQGFCDYTPEGEQRTHGLRVLMLGGNRKFYPAKGIVDACSNAYMEDLQAATSYTQRISERTADTAVDSHPLSHLGVSRLDLGD